MEKKDIKIFYDKTFTSEEDFESGCVVPVDKPYTWTSSDVVRKVKSMLKRRGFKKIKVGHAGTLDPLATGVLVVCIGKATKIAEKLQSERKEYITEVTLGATTASFDREHEVNETFEYEHITEQAVLEALESFRGEQKQVAPIYSAKWIDGKRAYEYAREGSDVEIKAVDITIYDIELLKFELPKVTVRIECSKGTYIRSFGRDLGLKLNSGGYLSMLQRTKSGDFSLENCYSDEEIYQILTLKNKENTEKQD